MAGPTIAFICPTCGHFDYAIKAIRSFLEYTPDPVAIVVDDASPDWDEPRWRAFVDSGRPRVSHHRFRENGGLTRSWNWGIRRAIDMGAGYVIAGNSDILFCEGWYRGLVEALESGHALAGPISNAPGPTSRGKACIAAYYPGFRLVDDLDYLNYVSGVLRRAYLGYHVVASINGFFQMARADVWWAGRYDDDHVYQPRNLMTGSEDELQARWAALGRKAVVCPASFIFHYRSVTRGRDYLHGLWYRENLRIRPPRPPAR